ncbi:unnamed protein product [Chilo suppressalis]|uniref:ABC transporter domain-containing protein n=1 Tax=Chilo suppressalis TaxID=168631 RepID=A0ABN8AZ17_CHISP|nr:unnamed protein product [Chilo suppressalis]
MPAYDNHGATISLEDVRPAVQLDLAARRRELKTQISTLTTRKEQAVCVRHAYKRYGSKSNPNVILDGLNMTVPKGAIYGLLGASGCGKTTLLSCIVGRRRLNSGDIWVLGGRPGSPGSGVPGPRIGYMPQEIALFGEFSIRETFLYFGMIAGMSKEEIVKNAKFLETFLELPDPQRLVKILSGGQQRRVSFAAALIHKPELLILDEPTVGVDPVLRQNIWDYLVDITKGRRTTVIITTHYIDETKQANVIGLMRGGRFLAEQSPAELIRRYQSETLEDVFLKLAVIQNRGKRRRSSILADVVDKVEIPATANPAPQAEEAEIGEISGEFGDNVSMSSKGRVVVTPDCSPVEMPPEEQRNFTIYEKYNPLKWNHMKALVWRNALGLIRNYGLLAFIIGLPMLQMVLFCVAVGRYPDDLPISVINYEVNSTDVLCDFNRGCAQNPETWEWDMSNFSCRYLHYLHQRQRNLLYYPTTEAALADAKNAKAWLIITFPSNFSESIRQRMVDSRDIDNATIDTSSIKMHMDNVNKQIKWMLKKDLAEAFVDVLTNMTVACDLPERALAIPAHIHDPIYGLKMPNMTDFAAPGVILTVIYFLAVALTSGALLSERNEGTLERSLVSGITSVEILFALLIVELVVMFLQTVGVMIIAFLVFELSQNGPIGWVVFLTFLAGICGMTFGFVVATLCDTDKTATYMALGSFLPMTLLSGVIWPIEGMHDILKAISIVLPLTKSTEGLRSMLQKGWGIDQPDVYLGFVIIIAWIFLHLTASICLLRFKKG